MAQVSKYPISREVYDRIFEIFLKTISSLNSTDLSSNFLQEFLSPTEQVMLSKRLAIAFLLTKEYKTRSISKILKVSMGTINRVSYRYKNGKYYKMVINKILENEKMEKFWLKVAEQITNVLGNKKLKGSGSWRYLNSEINKKNINKAF
jgi:Trp operon repressor